MIRIAVIGCGYWGPKLVRNFSNLEACELIAVADLNGSRLQSIQKKYPSVACSTDVRQILSRGDVDAVAIATSVSSHFELAKAALESGKHVLLEKPMTCRVEEAELLIEMAERFDRTLMVDHTFVYSAAIRKIRDFIKRGELGDVYYFDSVRVNLGLFQHDVNVVWDLAPHDLSILNYVIDEKPVSVSAVGASHISYTDPPLENIAYITLQFASGLIGHIHVNWYSPVKIRKMLIGGSQKMLVYDDLEPDEKIRLYDKGVTIDTPEKAYEALIQYRVGDAYIPVIPPTEALRTECLHFLDCIQRKRTPETSGQVGLEVVRLLSAIDYSLKKNGKPVDLDW